jgi:hypothetical protein
MLHALETFRVDVAGRPLLLWIAFALLTASARAWRGSHRAAERLSLAAISLGSAVALVAYIIVSLWYATVPYYFDSAEPTIPSVAWVFHAGGPLYHTLDSAERYAHIYGPYAFITHAWALSGFGPGILASKAVGVVAALTTLLLIVITCRRHTRTAVTVGISGGAAVFFLAFRNYSFWTRPDPLQLLSTALCLALAVWNPGSIGFDILAGAAAGFGWDLRFTGPLYTLVPFALIGRRRGVGPLLAAAVVALLVTAAPFALYPNVSWGNYLAWIRSSGRTGLLLATLRQNIEWTLFLCLPLLLVSFVSVETDPDASGEWRTLAGLLLLATCGIVVAASKPGAGPYHLLPFVPVVAYLFARRASALRRHAERLPQLAGWILVAAAVGAAQQAEFVTTVHERAQIADAGEIAEFARTHAGAIEMGYGSNESSSLERPLVVFHSGRYFLDQPAIREHQLQGMDIPPATIAAVSRCRVNLWLVPRGERPFSGRNSYAAALGQPLYSEAFRSVFLQTHRLVESTTHFDVWRCVGTGE